MPGLVARLSAGAREHASRFGWGDTVDALSAKKYVGRLVWRGTFNTAKTVSGTYRFRSPVTPVHGRYPTVFKNKACDSGTRIWKGVHGLGTRQGS